MNTHAMRAILVDEIERTEDEAMSAQRRLALAQVEGRPLDEARARIDLECAMASLARKSSLLTRTYH